MLLLADLFHMHSYHIFESYLDYVRLYTSIEFDQIIIVLHRYWFTLLRLIALLSFHTAF